MQKYRPDIDGLRAVAVLAVIAFHLLPNRFPAGGIGVDIFFVISGFLISGILLREASDGRLSFRQFYERRFRRIWPALLVAIAAITIAGAILSLPDELVFQSQSILVALFSVSNIFFWYKINYFDQRASEVPLLHTWSLGVEEQFYIIAPLAIWALTRWWPHRRGPILITATLISFGASVLEVRYTPTHAFYLLDSRGWELLIGLLLNLYPLRWCRQPALRELTAWLGAAGLGISFVFLQPARGFPGIAALLPCLSTAMLIGAGTEGRHRVGWLMSRKPILFVGLISYSLYLWHWPAILFTRAYFATDTSSGVIIPVSMAIAFGAAILSWRFVERPFRGHKNPLPIAAVVVMGTLLLSAAQLALIKADGWRGRFPAAATRYVETPASTDIALDCMVEGDSMRRCLEPNPHKPNILLLGDSHAMMLRSAIAKASGANVMLLANVGCQIDDIGTDDPTSECARRLHDALENAQWNHISLIILSSRWQPLRDDKLGTTIANLRKRAPVLVLGPTPEYRQRVPRLLAQAVVRGDPSFPASRRTPNSALDHHVMQIAHASGADFASPINAMCRNAACAVSMHGQSLYLDRDHLTIRAAELMISRLIRTQINPASASGNVLKRMSH